MNRVNSILKVSGQGVLRSYLYCVVMTICLRPSPVSPESACFGVIVKCDGVGFFDYKLAQVDERAIERIAGFFLRYGRDNVVRAMEWAAHDVDFAIEGEKEGRAAFRNLIRPRENVIRYGSPFVVATDDPASELERQYENLVSLPCISHEAAIIGSESERRIYASNRL